MEERLTIGVIRSSHGVKGFLKVESLSGEVEHFYRLKKVYLDMQDSPIPFLVEATARGGGRGIVLMKLEGIDSPEQASAFRGKEVRVGRAEAAPLKEGEFYLADLAGCRVFLHGREVGRVRTLAGGAAADFLEVIGPQEKSFLVPFMERFVGEVDVAQGRIDLREDFEIP